MLTQANVISIDSIFKNEIIENNLECFSTSENININEAIQSDFCIKYDSLKTKKNTIWAKFSIENRANFIQQLSLRSSKYGSIKLFNSKTELIGESGILYPINKRNKNEGIISSIQFSIKKNVYSTFYLQLISHTGPEIEYEPFPITIVKQDILEKKMV